MTVHDPEIISLTALSLSLVSLGVNFWYYWNSQRIAEVSLKPRVQMQVVWDDRSVVCQIENTGLGPAFINRIVGELNGQQILLRDPLDAKSFVALLRSHSEITYQPAIPLKGKCLRGGEKVPILEISSEDSRDLQIIVDQIVAANFYGQYSCLRNKTYTFPDSIVDSN